MKRPRVVDPRKVGGEYRSSYWNRTYTVLALGIEDGSPFRPVTVQWQDGTVTHHCTPWDRRDSIIRQA